MSWLAAGALLAAACGDEENAGEKPARQPDSGAEPDGSGAAPPDAGAGGSGGSAATGGASGASGSGPGGAGGMAGASGSGGSLSACGSSPPKLAPPLAPPSGETIEVGSVEQLMAAVASAADGSTILVLDGTYYLPGLLRFRGLKADVTLRSKSGNRDAVILDGSQSSSDEMIWFEDVRNVTVADLTVQNANVHCFTVKGEADADGVTIYNVRIKNCWERYVKGTAPNPISAADPTRRPRNGRIEHCLFEQDHKKDRDDAFNGDYIGGIDMMWLDNWLIRHNVFRGIQGRNNQGRAAIFIWNESQDVVVENNLVVGCDTGLAFGNPSGAPIHVTRGVMRNNMVTRGSYKAIELVRTRDAQVYNNSVYSDLSFDRAFHSFQGSDGIHIFNNLVRAALIRVDDAGASVENNLVGELAGFFADPASGDLHLTASGALQAAGAGLPLSGAITDYDGEARPTPPALGADECLP